MRRRSNSSSCSSSSRAGSAVFHAATAVKRSLSAKPRQRLSQPPCHQQRCWHSSGVGWHSPRSLVCRPPRELRTFSSPVCHPESPFKTPAICGNCTRRADGGSRASHPVQSPTHSHLPIVVASESDSPSSSSSSLSSSSSSSLFRFLAPFSPSFFSLAPLFFSFASLVPFLPSFFSLASLASLLVLLLLLSLASFFRWPPSFPWPSSFPWPPSSPWPPSWSFSSLGAPGSS